MKDQLTKEYFDERSKTFVTKSYLDKKLETFVTKEYFDKELDKKLNNFVTKDYFEETLDIKLKDVISKDYFKNTLDESLEKQRVEYEGHVSALTEDFQSSLAAVAEVVVAVARDMESIKEYIQEHKELHFRIDTRLNILEAAA